MEEIINSILDAEKKADEIVENAIASSKKSSLVASDKSFQIKEEAIKTAKDVRKAEITSANQRANVEYNKILSQGKDKVEKYKEQVSANVDKVAQEIFDKITK